MAQHQTVLYSPKGEKYVTGSRAEVTRLVAQGYSEKKPTAKQVEAAGGPVESK